MISVRLPYNLYEFGVKKLPGGNTPDPFEEKKSTDDIMDIINKFDYEYAHDVSFRWKNPDYDAEELIRKVKSKEIFI